MPAGNQRQQGEHSVCAQPTPRIDRRHDLVHPYSTPFLGPLECCRDDRLWRGAAKDLQTSSSHSLWRLVAKVEHAVTGKLGQLVYRSLRTSEAKYDIPEAATNISEGLRSTCIDADFRDILGTVNTSG